LRVPTLSGSSPHGTSSPWWSSRAVKVHRHWEIRVGWGSCGRVVLGRLRILSPVQVLVSAIIAVLLVRRVLKPASLVATLVSSWLTPTGTKDVFHNLSRFDALNRLFFGGFVSIRDRRSQDIFDHAPRETFYEEFDGLGVSEVITRNSGEAFEVIGVLIDFGPFQAKGFQLSSGALLALGVLVLGGKLREELVPDGWDVVDGLESVNPFSHRPSPFSNEWSLNKREGEGDSLDIRPHPCHLAVESDVHLQLIDKIVHVHTISCEDGRECAHHFYILGLLGRLLGDIGVRWGRWSSSSSTSPSTSASTSSSATSPSLASQGTLKARRDISGTGA